MSKEAVDLIKKAKESISAAELLMNKNFYQIAITRVYYAMFYIAEALLLTKELSYSSHKGVISGFGEEYVKKEIFAKKFGRGLNKVYELRINADYETEVNINIKQVKEYLELAKEFLETAKKYLKKDE